jgi:hypothetical protein
MPRDSGIHHAMKRFFISDSVYFNFTILIGCCIPEVDPDHQGKRGARP